MALFMDARIPVSFGIADLADDDALLLDDEGDPPVDVEGDLPVDDERDLPPRAMPAERLQRQPAPSHASDCACCLPRGAVGRQLAALFMARARGTTGFFRRVVVATSDPAAQAAVREAVAHDPLASACFRMVEPA